MGKQPDKVQVKELTVGDIIHYHRQTNKDQRGWRGSARVIGFDGQNVIIKHGGKVINSHPKVVRKFRSHLKHDEAWMDFPEKVLMTNGEQNGKEGETVKNSVKKSVSAEKNEKTAGILACQKFEKIKTSHIRVCMSNQRKLVASENCTRLKAPRIRYVSGSEIIKEQSPWGTTNSSCRPERERK